MTCQIIIACVTDAVHTLNRVAPEPQTWEDWWRALPEPVRFLSFMFVMVIATFILTAIVFSAILGLVRSYQYYLPERPVKFRHGRFIGD